VYVHGLCRSDNRRLTEATQHARDRSVCVCHGGTGPLNRVLRRDPVPQAVSVVVVHCELSRRLVTSLLKRLDRLGRAGVRVELRLYSARSFWCAGERAVLDTLLRSLHADQPHVTYDIC
jgi:hypothetical protein